MRVLVTSTPGLGHIHPVVPLAGALRDAGHEVVWATAEGSCDRVAGQGFTVVAAGLDAQARRARTLELRPDMMTLAPRRRRAVAYPTLFARVAAPVMFEDLRVYLTGGTFRPDVIVHEAAELAGAPLAASIGVPHVTVGFGGLVPPAILDDAADALAPVWASAGTAAAPAAGLYDHLYLHPFPESLGDAPIASTVRRMRPLGFDGAADGGLEWISGLGVDRPCVYLTFGTEGGGPPFAPLLAAINRVDVDAVLTTGPLTDPADLAAIAGKVRVVRYVPQRFVLARASAMVSHAGSGAMIGGALLGVTQVCVPMAADQFDNADSLAATGSSLTIEPAAASEDSFFEAMSRVLHDDGVRSSAQRLARSFAALPDPASFVPAVEALV